MRVINGLLGNITFRKVHLLIAALTVLSVVFLVLIKLHVLAPKLLREPKWTEISDAPGFLLLYNGLITVGFWAIYRTRSKLEYYRIRAWIYGALLGGVAGELLRFVRKFLLNI
jgi:hypothetical protein